MITLDFLETACSNLWRMKLRSSLTICGIIIANGALVAMLSFACGIQKSVVAEFDKLNLFNTIHVLPQANMESNLFTSMAQDTISTSALPDTAATSAGMIIQPSERSNRATVINDSLLAQISTIGGVSHAYPQDTFEALVQYGSEAITFTAQALPASFPETRDFGTTIAGRFYENDQVPEVVLSLRTVKRLGVEPDSIIGQTVSLKVIGRGHMAVNLFKYMIKGVPLFKPLNAAMEKPQFDEMTSSIIKRIFSIKGESEVNLTVCGVVRKHGSGFGFRLRDLFVPTGIAAGIDRIGFSDPVELLSRMTSEGQDGYSLAVVTIDRKADARQVRDKIEDMGLRTLDFIGEFAQMKKSFLIFDSLVGVFGLIALIIASLGITNTMLISILDRKREIGTLKALGAEDRFVHQMFVIESAVIGLIGSIGGIVLGWLLAQIGSLIMDRFIESQGGPPMDLFHFPLWVILGAIFFGVSISILAGLYPASRAAKIDPVLALRGD